MMHRQIIGLTAGDGLEVDHRDMDRLNNQRVNLRVCDRARNRQNLPGAGYVGSRSRFRGVSWDPRAGRWFAQCKLAGRNNWLGYFDREEDAGAAAAVFRAEHMPFAVGAVDA